MTTTKKTATELVPGSHPLPLAAVSHYAVLADTQRVLEVIRANLSGDTISEFDLDQIRIPSGGSTTWTVPSLTGPAPEDILEGIIVLTQRRRTYWETADPSGEPPDCFSKDMLTGVGRPGGQCAVCPLNEWGSAAKGEGKACKESRLLFFVRATDIMPCVVIVPPSSLKPIKNYLLKLPVPYSSAVTRLRLVQERSRSNIAYAEIVPEFVGTLDERAAHGMADYGEALRSVFERRQA